MSRELPQRSRAGCDPQDGPHDEVSGRADIRAEGGSSGGGRADWSPVLNRLGIPPAADLCIVPLAGGVSSDIVKVVAGGRAMVVKRALPKLKVASDWWAPTERNRFEAAWLKTAAAIVPGAVPAVLAEDRESGAFTMEYLEPETHPVWKTELRAGRVDLGAARAIGRNLAAIHAATAGDPAIAASFATDAIFHAIRLRPYLEATAGKHPAIAAELLRMAEETLAAKRALVHGDVSPKNILLGPRGPIFLDAECAWYGEPAFDIAFCLNHLLLKCLWNRPAADGFLQAFDSLRDAYLAGVSWEDPDRLEARAARLLAGLFLARVDGMSPVEYVTEAEDKERVRATAIPFILRPARRLGDIREAWAAALGPGTGQS